MPLSLIFCGTLAARAGSTEALEELELEELELEELEPPRVSEPQALRASPAVARPTRRTVWVRRRWVML
jgi:hypothetical protein